VEPTPVLRIGDADRCAPDEFGHRVVQSASDGRREGRRQSGGDADESLLVEALLDD
jgi:hypothetical protein